MGGGSYLTNILRRHEWKGDNKHGKILMTVRAKLIRDAQQVKKKNGESENKASKVDKVDKTERSTEKRAADSDAVNQD